MRVLVIIPAYNEEATLAGVIASVREQYPQGDIVVINDGSIDSTPEVASRSGVHVISHPFNMGIGATVQTGMKYAVRSGYDAAVQVDADGQHPTEEIGKILKPVIDGKADIVVGSRFLGDGDYRPSVARGAGIAIFSRLVSLILRKKVTDTTSGFRATGTRAMEFLSRNYPDDYPEVEALVLLHKKGFVIMEIPVTMAKRKGGRSSITPAKSVYYMVKVLLAIFVDLLKKVD